MRVVDVSVGDVAICGMFVYGGVRPVSQHHGWAEGAHSRLRQQCEQLQKGVVLDLDSRCADGPCEAAGTVCSEVSYEGMGGKRSRLALLSRVSGEASGGDRISGSERRLLYSVTASYLCVFSLSSAYRHCVSSDN